MLATVEKCKLRITSPWVLGMATVNQRKFTDPDWLRTITSERLARLLSPWTGYLERCGFTFAGCGDTIIDYSNLARVLFAPDPECPKEMVQALYYVHETASPEDMEHLVRACTEAGVQLPDDPNLTGADVAAEVWMADEGLLQSRHAEVVARSQRTFEYFGGREPRAFPNINDVTRRQVEETFDDWFEQNRRGRGCRVFSFYEPPHTWLLVRHGLTVRREASHRDSGEAGTEFFRPQKHDILRYDETSGEVGVHAGTMGERNLYLSTLGRVLFQSSEHFPTTPKFTLAPLVLQGADALACQDIEGIDSVRLVEYRQFWGGQFKETEIRRATDIFAARASRSKRAIRVGTPSAAVFKVKFTGDTKERSVTIRPKAVARYERNEDSELVERWLRARGFLVRRAMPERDDEELAELLEGN